MTNNQLLDITLKLYLLDKQWALSKDPRHSKLNFSKIVKSQEPTIEDWRITFLKDQLFVDKFLENAKYGDPEPFTLTSEGVKAAQTSHYVSTEHNRILDKEIKEQTLSSLKKSGKALSISRISMYATVAATIISLLALWLSRQQPTIDDVKQLKEEVNTLTDKTNKQAIVLDSLKNISPDTLKLRITDK